MADSRTRIEAVLALCVATFAKFATAQTSEDEDVSAQHDGHDHGDVHEELVLPHGIVMLVSGYSLILSILIALLTRLKPTAGIFSKFDKDTWHSVGKVHRRLAFLSYLGLLVGLLLITQDGLLFVDGHGALEYIHGCVGVAFIIAGLFQVHVGYTYRKFYRTSLFMRNTHRWTGRILAGVLVLWQLPSGALSLWEDVPVVAGLLWTVVPISLGTFLWYILKSTSTNYVDLENELPVNKDDMMLEKLPMSSAPPPEDHQTEISESLELKESQ